MSIRHSPECRTPVRHFADRPTPVCQPAGFQFGVCGAVSKRGIHTNICSHKA